MGDLVERLRNAAIEIHGTINATKPGLYTEAADALELQSTEGALKDAVIEAYEGGLQEIANLAPDNGKLEVAAARLNRAVSIALTTLDLNAVSGTQK